MNESKNIFFALGEWWEARQESSQPSQTAVPRAQRVVRWLTPNGGTLLLVAILIMTQQVWAKPMQNALNIPGPSATTVNYQGRLANPDGTPVSDGTYGMTFALYDAETGGSPLWTESHAAVPVSGGLFSVGLGSQTTGGIPTTTWNGDRWLEIRVGSETLSPRELIRSVPIAGMALTVPDGAIGTEQIADGSVTQAKAPFAAETYWGYWNTGSSFVQTDGMKIVAASYVFNMQGGQPVESFQMDISTLNLTRTPHVICQLVNVGTHVEFCHADFDGSTSTSLKFDVRRYDGGNVGSGLHRVNFILLGY